MFDYANNRMDQYSLKYVKLDPEDMEQNPRLERGRDYWFNHS